MTGPLRQDHVGRSAERVKGTPSESGKKTRGTTKGRDPFLKGRRAWKEGSSGEGGGLHPNSGQMEATSSEQGRAIGIRQSDIKKEREKATTQNEDY